MKRRRCTRREVPPPSDGYKKFKRANGDAGVGPRRRNGTTLRRVSWKKLSWRWFQS